MFNIYQRAISKETAIPNWHCQSETMKPKPGIPGTGPDAQPRVKPCTRFSHHTLSPTAGVGPDSVDRLAQMERLPEFNQST
jgi:hypothetical protein